MAWGGEAEIKNYESKTRRQKSKTRPKIKNPAGNQKLDKNQKLAQKSKTITRFKNRWAFQKPSVNQKLTAASKTNARFKNYTKTCVQNSFTNQKISVSVSVAVAVSVSVAVAVSASVSVSVSVSLLVWSPSNYHPTARLAI